MFRQRSGLDLAPTLRPTCSKNRKMLT